MERIVRELASFIFIFLELLLALRFVLKLFAANAASPFVSWIYQNTQPLLEPFLFAFPTPSAQGGYVIEFTTLFAMFIYAFAGYILQELLYIIGSRSKRRKK